MDDKVTANREEINAENQKKKDNQYDYKQKEKELNDHLETMTQVA